jgi:hypothetical protein
LCPLIPRSCGRLVLRTPDAADFVHAEIAVWTVRDDRLPGDRLELLPVDRDLHLVRFEGDRSPMRAIASKGARYDQAAFRASPMS